MSEIQIKVKHQGKVYDVPINPESNGEELKLQLYSLTNVEPENQKILAKKMVKDDTPLSSLGLKSGMTINLVGSPSAGIVIQAPREKIKFTEDMTEAELAQQEGAVPAGLQNTGNTCYANATLQTLRSIPELQEALATYTARPLASAPSSSLFSAEQLAQHGIGGLGGGNDLTAALGDLYSQMGKTQMGFPPIMFLTTLRQKFTQFNERAKNGHGYAQQDAEELWTNLIQTLRDSLKPSEAERKEGFNSWVDQWMGGKFEITTTCDDAPDEGTTSGSDDFNVLKCNIAGDTNHLREGIQLALNEKISKISPTLGVDATYSRAYRISRLPKYLPVQLVRFFWRKDTQKKAKILRKVTFQHEIDLLEFCTEDLRKKLIPVRDKIRELRKEEEDVERAKKRQKRVQKELADGAKEDDKVRGDEPLQKKNQKAKEQELKAFDPRSESDLAKDKAAAGGTQDTTMGGTEEEKFKTDEEIERERAENILAAKKELLSLVNEDMKKDSAAGQTGLYELRGVVTHQGSSADSGHYTAYVKKTASDGKAEDGKWWWFNDEKVQEVDSEKIETLAGGGETHSALILLYRAVALPEV